MSYIDGNGLSTIWKKIKTLYSPLSHTHSPNDLTSAVPVTKGGTGAVTAAKARSNLDVAKAVHDHTASKDLWMAEDDVNGLWHGDSGKYNPDSVETAMCSLSNKILEVSTTSYSLPTATSDVLGGVKVGSNITNTNGTISLSKQNVTSALGYTPPTENANNLVRSVPSISTGLLYLTGSMQSAASTSSLYKNSELYFVPGDKTLCCPNITASSEIQCASLSASSIDCAKIFKDGVNCLGTTLFDDDISGLGSYDLKDTISNYNYLRIYFVTAVGASFSSEVYCGKDSGSIITWLTAFDFDTDNGIVRHMYKLIVLTGAVVYVGPEYELNFFLDNNNFKLSEKNDGIRIRQVVGF